MLQAADTAYADGPRPVKSTSGVLHVAVQSAVAATPGASELHLGEVGGNTGLLDVTFTPDTSAVTAGDVLADTQVLTDAMRINDGTGVLQSLVLSDEDDQTAAAIDVVIFDANQSLGSENAAPSISDANARGNILGIISFAAADFIDLGGVKVATKLNIGMPVKAATGTKNLYAALIARGTPTQTGSGITAKFGFLRD